MKGMSSRILNMIGNGEKVSMTKISETTKYTGKLWPKNARHCLKSKTLKQDKWRKMRPQVKETMKLELVVSRKLTQWNQNHSMKMLIMMISLSCETWVYRYI